MNLQEMLVFMKNLGKGFDHIGAILPTSRRVARTMVAEALRQKTPKSILEVGPGTGPITTELVRHLKADDRLTLVELDAGFVSYLRQRFETEPELQRVRHQVEILHQSVTDMEGTERFDYIVSALPLTRLPADLVEQCFETFQRLLKPGGTLSFLEYAFLRKLRALRPGRSPDSNFLRVNGVIKKFVERYQFRKDQVLWALPPANVRNLRFSDAPSSAALNLQPRDNNKRVGSRWSNLGFSSEALDLVIGLGGLAWWMARAGKKWWPVPAAMGTFAAWFHRDPHREVLPSQRSAYAASDGQVMKVDTVRHPRLGGREWVRVCVFLSPLDVHINRAPVAGRVIDRWEEPGGFMPAFLEDESEQNASRYIVIEGVNGPVAVAQRAGFLARRIITWPSRGELLAQGERYGLIRFGSRTDILFPADQVEITVRAGDKLAAGQSVIARYLG